MLPGIYNLIELFTYLCCTLIKGLHAAAFKADIIWIVRLENMLLVMLECRLFVSCIFKDDSVSVDSKSDAAHFENIISTMHYLKFTDCQIDQIWHLLAAILHLGNISFCETLKESTDASKVDDCDRSELRFASTLLGVRTVFSMFPIHADDHIFKDFGECIEFINCYEC